MYIYIYIYIYIYTHMVEGFKGTLLHHMMSCC